jgi:hypothetical protein
MKPIVTALLLTTLMWLTSVAQQSSAPPASGQSAASSLQIAPGSVIPVDLSKTIDAKKVKAGDPIVATVQQDMKTQEGELLVPKSAKVIGHITEAQARSKEEKESHLGIVFDQVVLKNGPVQLPMSIQAVIWMQNNGLGAPGTGTSVAMPVTGMSSAGGPPQSAPGNASSSNPQMSPVNGQTQGVIGIPFVKLAPGSNGQGSVLTCEKGNVRLEEGTILLLKVNR